MKSWVKGNIEKNEYKKVSINTEKRGKNEKKTAKINNKKKTSN